MRDFIFNVSTKILFGRDQMKNLASEIKKYGQEFCLPMVEAQLRKVVFMMKL